MTKEEIWAMEAGLDLDFQVDIKVMAGKGGYLGCPGYSTDISATWQVVEKMLFGKWRYDLSFNEREQKHEARFIKYRKALDYIAVFAHSQDKLPEAICKVALLAKLEETKQ